MLHLDAVDPGPFMGVVVGAVLATMGGLVGGQIENRLNRKARQRSAALLFGEILAGLRLILRLANETRGRGDPYGPVTMRITKAALRETQVYDRNRETLFSVDDAKLRTETHILLAQLSLTIEAAMEGWEELKTLQKDGAADDNSDAAARQRAEIITGLANSFDFIMELHSELTPLIAQYERLAGQSFAEPQRDVLNPPGATQNTAG
jgi:hypothetical protein